MNTPVALIIFNRPHLTAQVFAEIANAKPTDLFVIADGPRDDHPDDQEKCRLARAATENIDWPCNVRRLYSEVNLGCGTRPASGISALFEEVDRAIILEDDCIPDPSFWRFCEELLDRYAEDERVMQVSGQNLQFGNVRGPGSYFFSWHNICLGGFATWRRAWQHYDFQIKRWAELKNTYWLSAIVNFEPAEIHWAKQFDTAYAAPEGLSFWDYQWTFACWEQSGLSILPNKTLLTNIGYGEDATHLHNDSPTANIPLEQMTFPLQHPVDVRRHAEADQFFVENVVVRKRKPLSLRKRIWQATPDPLHPILRSLGRIKRAIR